MPRLLRRCAPLAVCALLAVPIGASADPVAQASKRCNLKLSEQRNLGTTYVFSLSASGTSCSSAKSLARSYHSCRRSNGGADGKCGRVSGYSCSERRYNKSRFSYDATATCRKSGRTVVQKYQQNI